MARLADETQPFPLPQVDDNGVDRSQVRRALALTPSERLRSLESALSSLMKVRDGFRRAETARDSDSTR
jgi:hypothetical protein